jgi:hypothetical protein
MTSLTLQIASLSDRDKVVSEIWFGNDQVAEVSNERNGQTIIEIFSAPSGGAWSFALDEFQKILVEARDNLSGK